MIDAGFKSKKALVRDLLKKAEIPATYTLMAAGVVPYGDPMNIGMVGMHGCYTSNRAVACLLYTSP